MMVTAPGTKSPDQSSVRPLSPTDQALIAQVYTLISC